MSTPMVTQDAGAPAAALVEEFLRILMIPDPQGALAFTAPDLQIRFTGGRPMAAPAECSAFNASRYAWVRKRFESTEVVSGNLHEGDAVITGVGTQATASAQSPRRGLPCFGR